MESDMYKQLGLQFADVPSHLQEKLHSHMAQLVSYYKRTNEHFQIASNQKRQTYRSPVDVDLPKDLNIEIWMYYSDLERYIKLRPKDISTGGASVVIPFEDKTIGLNTSLTLLVQFAGAQYQILAHVKYVGKITVSKGQKSFLKKYFNQIHSQDKR